MISLKCDKNIEKLRLVEELHAPARRNFPRRRVIVRDYDDLWQADIIKMRSYSRFNKSSMCKYAWIVPLKTKGGSETADAIINKIARGYPRNMQTNMGKEFYNTDVERLMKKHDINHYFTYSMLKASVVERFNRTLKNDMWKMFTLNKTYKWISCRDLYRIKTRASIERWYAVCRRYPRDRRKTLWYIAR
ncbi:hypothetical protein ACFW04_014630 [Cataglyphis niger]